MVFSELDRLEGKIRAISEGPDQQIKKGRRKSEADAGSQKDHLGDRGYQRVRIREVRIL